MYVFEMSEEPRTDFPILTRSANIFRIYPNFWMGRNETCPLDLDSIRYIYIDKSKKVYSQNRGSRDKIYFIL